MLWIELDLTREFDEFDRQQKTLVWPIIQPRKLEEFGRKATNRGGEIGFRKEVDKNGYKTNKILGKHWLVGMIGNSFVAHGIIPSIKFDHYGRMHCLDFNATGRYPW